MYRDIAELPIKRRAYERHEAALPVQYKALQEARAPLKGTLTVDIGGGGPANLERGVFACGGQGEDIYVTAPREYAH